MTGCRRGRAGNEPVGGLWGVSWRDYWRPEVCPGFMVVTLAKGPERAARLGASRGWWKHGICPALPEAQHRWKSPWRGP
ncbi:hypothetical protein ACFOY8_19605 [Thalassospira xianhensis]|uniref:hypothetical protein n=1 Tax=Thalassospira xianhensis TaxID=478503 RepID=UPI00360FEC0A